MKGDLGGGESSEHMLNETEMQSSKRLKFGKEDLSQFQPGSIVKLRLENFVTYSLTEFHLSPSLNMIIGPNGSGKSTFVCAVCLGLAGKPEYIGRGKRVDSFIKNGENRGLIEVTLKRDPGSTGSFVAADGTTKVSRVLWVGKKSEYYLNDEPVSELTVKNLMGELNIQLDNLCQFLSQERVEEFARLKSDKLLMETVRSVNVNLLESFKNLRTLQEEQITEAKELELKTSKLRDLNETRDKLVSSVQALEAFKRKKQELDINEKLLPYVKIKDHKRKCAQYKKKYQEARDQLKALIADKEPMRQAQQAIDTEAAEKQDIKSGLETKFQHLQSEFKVYPKKQQELEEKVREKQGKIKYYEQRTFKVKEAISGIKEQLSNERNKLTTLPAPDNNLFDEIDTERKRVSIQNLELEQEVRDLNTRSYNLGRNIQNWKGNLHKLEQSLTSKDRIGILDRKNERFQQLKNAVLYIRSKPEMRGKVLEPPIMTISAKSPQFAAYLGACTDFATSLALTMVDSKAYENFNDEILKKFAVNLRELSPEESIPPVPVSELKKLGFRGYLSDFLTGDSGVLEMLCQQHRIHAIPVASENLSSQQMNYLKTPDENGKLRFRRVIAGDYICDIKRSLYGARQVFSTDFKVRPCHFYQGSILSDERKEQINTEISALRTRIDATTSEIREIEHTIGQNKDKILSQRNEDRTLRNKASELNQQRKARTQTEQLIRTLEDKLEMAERESRRDVTVKIKQLQGQIQEHVREQIKGISEIVKYISKLQKLQNKINLANIEYLEASNKMRSMNEVLGFFNETEDNLTEAYEEAKRTHNNMKGTPEYKSWIEQIKTYSSAEKSTLAKLAEEYEKNNSLELKFVSDLIDRLHSEIGMMNQDESVIEKMRQTEKELETLNRSIPQIQASLNDLTIAIEKEKSVLEPNVDGIVEGISTNFSRLFQNVGSGGSVVLEKNELFSNWKINIMVRFRDSALMKKLDSQIQSGGERAVSTVLYMIALQEFTSAPFRIVDEINQGMDTRNERIVHKAMVENACAEKTSQYILVTPKLLTNLHYHEKVRVHCVMAGAWIPDPTVDHPKVHFGQSSNYVF